MIRSHENCRLKHPAPDAAAAIPAAPRRGRSVYGISICLVVTAALAACGLDINPGLNNGPGSLLVDPGLYSDLPCKDLIAKWNALRSREQDLRRLQDKANEGPGGAFIGTLAYRTDYEVVLSNEKVLLHEAAAKHCELTHSYESDRDIR